MILSTITRLFTRRPTQAVKVVDLDAVVAAVAKFDAISAAVADLAQTVFGDYPSYSMTCWEAEAIAHVLAAGGFPEKAKLVLLSHAGGDDDEEDTHYQGEMSDEDFRAAIESEVFELVHA